MVSIGATRRTLLEHLRHGGIADHDAGQLDVRGGGAVVQRAGGLRNQDLGLTDLDHVARRQAPRIARAATLPLTRVPLRLPRSTSSSVSPRRTMRACSRDTLGSSTRTVAADDRPTTISAPSSTSMTWRPVRPPHDQIGAPPAGGLPRIGLAVRDGRNVSHARVIGADRRARSDVPYDWRRDGRYVPCNAVTRNMKTTVSAFQGVCGLAMLTLALVACSDETRPARSPASPRWRSRRAR